MNESWPSRRHAVFIFLLGACAFLLLIGRQDIVRTHEARVAQTARVMAASGWPWKATRVDVPATRLIEKAGHISLRADPSAEPLHVNPWIVPVLNGEIRLQKPPLPYWCAAIMFRLFGESGGTARSVPALLGAAAAPILYDLARRLLGRRAALVAAMVWISSYFVVSEFRKTMADPYLAFFALACVWTWVCASVRASRAASARWIVLFHVFLALGLLAKGPVVLAHVAIALLAYHFCYRRSLPSSLIGHGVGIALLIAIALPWPWAVWRSVPEALALWRFESLGELADNRRNAAPFWAYLPKLPYLALPWTPLWAAGVVYPFMRSPKRRRRVMFPLGWMGMTVVFFSFVNLKKDAYLLPAMPAQVLLIAQLVRGMLGHARLRGWAQWMKNLIWFQTALGFVLAIIVLVLLVSQLRHFSSANWPTAMAVVVVIVAVALPLRFRLSTAEQANEQRMWRWFVAETVACTMAVGTFISVYGSIRENARSPRRFASTVVQCLTQGNAQIAEGRALHRGDLSPALAFYLPLDSGREETATTVVVVSARDARASEVAADFTASAGRAVTDIRLVSPDNQDSADSRSWKLFELTVEDRQAPAGTRPVR